MAALGLEQILVYIYLYFIPEALKKTILRFKGLHYLSSAKFRTLCLKKNVIVLCPLRKEVAI